MRHYVYRTVEIATGNYYIGVRSCRCPIEEDKYMGSGSWIVFRKRSDWVKYHKEILGVFDSREDAQWCEYFLLIVSRNDPMNKNVKRSHSKNGNLGKKADKWGFLCT